MVRTYSFRCENFSCGIVFEKDMEYEKIKKSRIPCPRCNSSSKKVIVFTNAIIFVGNDFYINQSKKDKNK